MENNTSRNKAIASWQDKNDIPSFDYLQSLAQEGTVESLSTLRAIAEDLDTNFNSNTSTEELIGMIRASVKRNDD